MSNDGKLMMLSNGKIALAVNGKAVTAGSGDDCCCTGSGGSGTGPNCLGCAGDLPKCLSATIGNVQLGYVYTGPIGGNLSNYQCRWKPNETTFSGDFELPLWPGCDPANGQTAICEYRLYVADKYTWDATYATGTECSEADRIARGFPATLSLMIRVIMQSQTAFALIDIGPVAPQTLSGTGSGTMTLCCGAEVGGLPSNPGWMNASGSGSGDETGSGIGAGSGTGSGSGSGLPPCNVSINLVGHQGETLRITDSTGCGSAMCIDGSEPSTPTGSGPGSGPGSGTGTGTGTGPSSGTGGGSGPNGSGPGSGPGEAGSGSGGTGSGSGGTGSGTGSGTASGTGLGTGTGGGSGGGTGSGTGGSGSGPSNPIGGGGSGIDPPPSGPATGSGTMYTCTTCGGCCTSSDSSLQVAFAPDADTSDVVTGALLALLNDTWPPKTFPEYVGATYAKIVEDTPGHRYIALGLCGKVGTGFGSGDGGGFILEVVEQVQHDDGGWYETGSSAFYLNGTADEANCTRFRGTVFLNFQTGLGGYLRTGTVNNNCCLSPATGCLKIPTTDDDGICTDLHDSGTGNPV